MTTADEAPPRPVITVELSQHVATVWLDRPEKRNALGMPFFDQLPQVMGDLGRDRSVRAVVIAARGPAFSVGLDLTALVGIAGDSPARDSPTGDSPAGDGPARRTSGASAASATRVNLFRLQDAITAVAECPKPVIAAVHGYCLGGGVDLTSACDIRLASADATFSVRETRMAMVADLGSLQRLPLVLPMGYVAELAYTGKDIDAGAERIGYVNTVYPDQRTTLAAALEMAADIARNSPLAVQGTKAVLSEAYRERVAAGLRYVAAWNAAYLRSDDLTEAVTAFFEKREPNFTGD